MLGDSLATAPRLHGGVELNRPSVEKAVFSRFSPRSPCTPHLPRLVLQAICPLASAQQPFENTNPSCWKCCGAKCPSRVPGASPIPHSRKPLLIVSSDKCRRSHRKCQLLLLMARQLRLRILVLIILGDLAQPQCSLCRKTGEECLKPARGVRFKRVLPYSEAVEPDVASPSPQTFSAVGSALRTP